MTAIGVVETRMAMACLFLSSPCQKSELAAGHGL